jgi:hypothetical protein
MHSFVSIMMHPYKCDYWMLIVFQLNLGNVECFRMHFDIVEELTKASDVEILPAIKGVTLR